MSTRIKSSLKPVFVTRQDARVAEEMFFERLQGNLNRLQGLFNPLDGRTYDASARHRIAKTMDARATELKAAIKRFVEKDLMKVYEEMPKNGVQVHEIVHKEILGARSVKIVVAGAAFSPVEDLLRSGRSARAIGAEEVAKWAQALAAHEEVFYYIGAFATTTFESGARSVLSGSNYLVALVDRLEAAWRTCWAPDTRWRGAARVFDLTTDEEKIEAVFTFCRRRQFALLMDELTEDYVFDELGYPIPLIREAFERLAAEDRFVRFDTASRPFRLVRNYG